MIVLLSDFWHGRFLGDFSLIQGDLENLPAISENSNIESIHYHTFLLTLSQFGASNGKEGHFEQKVLLKLSSKVKLRNFDIGMKIICSGTTSLICTAHLGFSHILWCGLLLCPFQW